MNSPLADLLAFVLDHPEDDTARLIYADALEESDDEDQKWWAELIRVQIEIARSVLPMVPLTSIDYPTSGLMSCQGLWSYHTYDIPRKGMMVSGSAGMMDYTRVFLPCLQIDSISTPSNIPWESGLILLAKDTSETTISSRRESLLERQRIALTEIASRWSFLRGVNTRIEGNRIIAGKTTFKFRRGMLDLIACSSRFFSRYASELFATQPIREIILSHYPEVPDFLRSSIHRVCKVYLQTSSYVPDPQNDPSLWPYREALAEKLSLWPPLPE